MPVLRLFAATALIATAAVACSSSSASPTGLAAALALSPRDATSVLFTDWAAFGHKSTANGPAFAGGLVSYDVLLAKDLGFRSADALWEADVLRPNTGPATVLRFPDTTELAGVEARLARFGYTKTGVSGHDVLTGKGLSSDGGLEHSWQVSMQAVAIDAKRHLLVAGGAGATVNAIFAVSSGGQSLASRPDVHAVVQQVGHAVGAYVAVDAQACQPIMTALLGSHGTPQMVAQLRQRIAAVGTFTPFTAEAVAAPSRSGDTGTAALAFPDASAAKANAKGRAAAPPVVNEMVSGRQDSIRVTSTNTSGAVLTLALRTSSPRVLPQAVQTRALGLDVCL